MARRQVERIGSGDLVELATDVGPVPMNVGALLLLAPDTHTTAETVEAALRSRLGGVARLRQRLVHPPRGLGRPYWLDDGRFDVAEHVTRVRCAGSGRTADLLETAATLVTAPLARDRPLWRAALVTGADDGGLAVVVVLHHVVADGIGGLAVLGRLVDGTPLGGHDPEPAPPPAPRRSELAVDHIRSLGAGLRRAPAVLVGAWRGRHELGPRGRAAPRCSLNAPTGPRRRLAVTGVDLADLKAAGRRHGATINDVLLVAVTGAMAQVLADRGEHVDELVVSVPVSARAETTSSELGNRVGVMPVPVPVTGPHADRLRQVALLTLAHKRTHRGTSAALVGPAFRILARAGVFRWFVDRQRLVNTFLTNLPGPRTPLTFAGVPVRALVPVTITAGNVGVAFAALSYAGRLSVTVITDPDVVPEIDRLTAVLGQELAVLAAC